MASWDCWYGGGMPWLFRGGLPVSVLFPSVRIVSSDRDRWQLYYPKRGSMLDRTGPDAVWAGLDTNMQVPLGPPAFIQKPCCGTSLWLRQNRMRHLLHCQPADLRRRADGLPYVCPSGLGGGVSPSRDVESTRCRFPIEYTYRGRMKTCRVYSL